MLQDILTYTIIGISIAAAIKMIYSAFKKNKSGCQPDQCINCRTAANCDSVIKQTDKK